MNTRTPTRFTGHHMLAIMIAFFGVVIVVNVVMARFAVSTFTGEVVENGYVASQHFNRWLDEAHREQGLGWRAKVERGADGHIVVSLVGAPAAAVLTAQAREPLGRVPGMVLHFVSLGGGRFRSLEALPAARWRLRLEARAGQEQWRGEEDVR